MFENSDILTISKNLGMKLTGAYKLKDKKTYSLVAIYMGLDSISNLYFLFIHCEGKILIASHHNDYYTYIQFLLPPL